MTEPDDSDGSDEWGMEELEIKDVVDDGAKSHQSPYDLETTEDGGDDDDDYWKVEEEEEKEKEIPPKKDPPKVVERSSEPMIIVDLTRIDPNIHSKHDRNSVNDAEAASTLRKTIESDYLTFSKDAERISDGTILPCSCSVWRDALVRLRDERPGHYFVPIFPPKTKTST